MKIFIPSKGRSKEISTHLMLSGLDYKVVVHNEFEFADYSENKTLPDQNILVSEQPFNISAQRNWIKDNLVADGEWFCFMDDNIKNMTAFPAPYYLEDTLPVQEDKSLRKILEHQVIDNIRLIDIFLETIEKAESIGAKYCGFANIENYFFRGKKWKTVGMIVSKCCLVKKVGLRYSPQIRTMDDYDYSAQNLAEYGKVLCNAFVFPQGKHNERGGIGTFKERLPLKINDCKILMDKYPELFRYKARKNSHPEAEIVLRFYQEKQIENWRRKYHASSEMPRVL